MQVFHPRSTRGREALLQLLQVGLRPDGAPFPIADEYPLVLGVDAAELSYCLGQEEAPVAHANLWPRRLLGHGGQEQVMIGLVGNVVTHAEHRGQGVMRTLLDALKEEARRLGLGALVLWSDLHEFYQKCGFTSCGEESRWLIPSVPRGYPAGVGGKKGTPAPSRQDLDQPYPPSVGLCKKLLGCRPKGPVTLERSPEEFCRLLDIPGVSLLAVVNGRNERCERFTIMGKGCDMVGVVHEWGASDAASLLAGVQAQGLKHGYKEVMLLTPPSLPPGWAEILRQQALQVQIHPMALAWSRDDRTRELLQQSFIWGLDSI